MMNKIAFQWIVGVLFLFLGCKPTEIASQNNQNWIDIKIAAWQKVTTNFVLENDLSNERIAKNYMKNAFKIKKEGQQSTQEVLLNLMAKSYGEKIFNSKFFIIENVTQHGIFYVLLIDCKGENWIKTNLLQGELSIVRREKASFSEYENMYKKCKILDQYKSSTSRKRNTIINRFEGDSIQIKLVSEP